MLIKIWGKGCELLHEKRCDFSWWEDKKKMTIINWGALYYSFGTSSKNYKVAQNFRVSLDGKMETNLKLLKDKILYVNNFFLFEFVLCLDRQRTISKLSFVSTYVSRTNNLKLIITFLTMNRILWKIQVLIHSNNFRTGILF